jgi:hypothetical protein
MYRSASIARGSTAVFGSAVTNAGAGRTEVPVPNAVRHVAARTAGRRDERLGIGD